MTSGLVAYTDASMSIGRGHRLAAWAVLVTGDLGNRVRLDSGPCPQPDDRFDNNWAECFAVVRGAEILASLGADRCLVYTDSQHAVRMLGPRGSLAPWARDRRLQADMEAVRLRRPVDVLWIPGHQQGRGHAARNRAVDREAGRALRETMVRRGLLVRPNRHRASSW